ncbi:MAG: ABC transporter ATP-binding protein [Candidatus Kariarchaeaceae archaeon]
MSEIMLDVSKVNKKYNENKSNEIHVLKGINFQIPSGQLCAVMGPSGCGKTTLLNLIGGLDTVSSGNIEIGGSSITSISDKELTKFRRDSIGFIFQLFNLFEEQSVYQNISLPLLLQRIPLDEVRKRVEILLQEVGLIDRIYSTPNKLSGGEQQKVAIVRTLIGNPKIILADEPTGDLDQQTSEDIMALFRRMQIENQDLSIIIVTHSEKISSLCDRILRISDGKIKSDTKVK